jgi:iron complex transport system ATP-binding protein
VTAALVRFQGVDLAYRSRDVLRDVSFQINAGDRVALVGPNGAGKSSLLRALVGLVRVQHGTIELDGRPIEGLTRASIARRISAVPAASLPFSMRVEEVVALGRLPHEDPIRGLRPADRAAVAAAIERVGLGHLLGRDARELSLGERQLVLLALAVAQAAPLMLLDEPTVHLDLRHQVETMQLLADLNERDGTTIVAVMHDLNLAAHFFPRVLVLDRGRLVADGPARDILAPALVREVFGVDPRVFQVAQPGDRVAP